MTEDEKKTMLEEMKNDLEKGSSNKKYWNIPSKKEGTFPIRILPPLSKLGEKTFYFKHHVHWINGTPYECLNQSIEDKNGEFHEKENCPICNFTSKLYKTSQKGDDDWNLANQIRSKERTVSRIVVRGSEDETTPKFYEYGSIIFKMLYHIIAETDFGNIVDPKNGRDFNLSKTGTGRQSKYETSTPSANITPIFSDPKKLKEVFTKASNMKYNSLIEFTTADKMKKALEAFINGEDEISTPTHQTKSEPIRESYKEPEVENDEEVSEEEDEINSILDEFTS